MSCALHLADNGRDVQFVTLDDKHGLEMEYSSRVVYRKRFAEHGVRTTIDHPLTRVHEAATTGRDLPARADRRRMELTGPQVVVEHGTIPVDDVFHASASLGQSRRHRHQRAARRPPPGHSVPGNAGFELHRIGDAVTSRNVHGAIYDALRLCMAL